MAGSVILVVHPSDPREDAVRVIDDRTLEVSLRGSSSKHQRVQRCEFDHITVSTCPSAHTVALNRMLEQATDLCLRGRNALILTQGMAVYRDLEEGSNWKTSLDNYSGVIPQLGQSLLSCASGHTQLTLTISCGELRADHSRWDLVGDGLSELSEQPFHSVAQLTSVLEAASHRRQRGVSVCEESMTSHTFTTLTIHSLSQTLQQREGLLMPISSPHNPLNLYQVVSK